MTGLKTFAARMGFVVVLVLGLMGLGQGMLGCAASNSPEDAAKAALTSYLSQVQQGNVGDAVENVDSQYGAMVDTDTGQAFVEAWLEGFSYTLGDVTMEGDDACTIETTVTCKTLAPVIASGVGKAFTNAFGSLFSGGDQETIQKQTEEILIEELNGAELSTTTVNVAMENVGGTWQPTSQGKAAVVSAMTGDLSALSSQFANLLGNVG